MKKLFLFFLLSVFLLGCSKEKKTYKSLKGTWEVNRTDTFWINASNSQPSYIHQDQYATIEFDKDGKGKMIIPAGVYYWNGNEVPYDAETIELEAETERILFRFDPNMGYTNDSEYFNLTWKFNKESFVLTGGGISYNNNTSSYSDVTFTCKKKD